MESQKFSELGEREREQYNKGLERAWYEKIFNHCRYFYIRRRYSMIKEMMQCAQGKKVLEIGSTAWKGWLDNNSIFPSSLTCINISEAEIQAGVDSAVRSDNSPEFILMDAHDLQFEDGTFDFVYGDAILHHLNMVSALDEIFRVLKPNGKILFVEPLDVNPMGKLIRSLTKKARTSDEQPLRLCDITEIEKRFETQFFYEELLSVPCGVLSGMLFKNPSNSLMRFAFRVDQFLDRNFSWLRSWFRHALISGTRR
ncbi:methyltransferase domain-containing protein [Nitrospinaceae bacterium]|nr:methyltransferase domain-containing protein [Nitrospinaceae bacterium]